MNTEDRAAVFYLPYGGEVTAPKAFATTSSIHCATAHQGRRYRIYDRDSKDSKELKGFQSAWLSTTYEYYTGRELFHCYMYLGW
jgi:hypothetical protein